MHVSFLQQSGNFRDNFWRHTYRSLAKSKFLVADGKTLFVKSEVGSEIHFSDQLEGV